ncbi:uncharacterized protein LOC114528920 [Dendronephthya gigantea]|uniref:uncharacterized protein LOC114528920 n=1 Tax=Dendronephthya gigantea TaxID=151771 RepID=UPI0010699534|nr:uncharacterized protein LOC114528920 [Dendronephthya gigantea]
MFSSSTAGRYINETKTSAQQLERLVRNVRQAVSARVLCCEQAISGLEACEKLNVIKRGGLVAGYAVKPNKIRLGMDPKDLKEAVKREYYPMKTFEDDLTRLPEAKIFSTLDATSGFWQIPLDEESSFLTCFNTPFGRYRSKSLPYFALHLLLKSTNESWKNRLVV